MKFDVELIGKYFANGGRMLWTPNLPYRIPAAVLQILPLVANLWGCRWDKFVLFIFSFSFAVYVICFVWVLMPVCLSLLSIVWNKCARHAGSGQCFRPALFWRHHTRLGVQYFWVVTACGRSYFVLVCVGYNNDRESMMPSWTEPILDQPIMFIYIILRAM